MHQNQQEHEPVLLDKVLACLEPKSGESYLDLTAGYGGHAEAILARTEFAASVVIDRDQQAANSLKSKFAGKPVEIVHDDFLSASQGLNRQGKQFDLILADLGVSSPHLNTASRGFSFQAEGPLDMRMDQSQSLTAADIINSSSQDELAQLIREYGEERHANKIAQAITANRPLKTTVELSEVVAKAVKGYHKLHPATRTFQAIRIAVNEELTQLERSLPIWFQLLKPGGRIAIISFHSLEDRLVKHAMMERSGKRYDAELKLLTKSPITANPEEIAFNPRARSAKLRAAAKIKTKKGSFHANSGKKHIPRL